MTRATRRNSFDLELATVWLKLLFNPAAPWVFVVLGGALRLRLLPGGSFHPDEALYATWARFVASGQDIWLARQLVDKPPLEIYVLASLFGTLGASEMVARIPGVIASMASIGLLYDIAFRLYQDRNVAAIAALIFALSPLALLFAPTAFMDSAMVFWLLACTWAAIHGSFGWAGLLYGLCLATKQDAVLFAPLLLAFLLHGTTALSWQIEMARRAATFTLGCALPLSLVLLWSLARPQPGFLSASLNNFGGLALVGLDRYLTRATAWLPLLAMISSPWLLACAAIAIAIFTCGPRRTGWKLDAAFSLIALLWIAIHIALSFPIWDRYGLPLVPAVSILMGRAASLLWDALPGRRLKASALVVFSVLLILSTQAALAGEVPAGRAVNSYDGLGQIGEWFWHSDTTAMVVYEHELSWELGYHTFGRGLDRRWMPDAGALAADAEHMALAQRYVVLAAWEPMLTEMDAALAQHHLKATRIFAALRSDGTPLAFVYHITPLDLKGVGHAPVSDGAFYSLTD